MRFFKKILWIGLWTLFFWFFLIVKSADLVGTNCSIVNVPDIDVSLYWTDIYEDLYPESALEQALINLKAACCENIQWNSMNKENCKNLPKVYPQSRYLYDHLIDVALRRLDVGDLYDWLDADDKMLERKEYLTEHGGDDKGNHAGGMQSQYKTYWWYDSTDYKLWLASWDDVIDCNDNFLDAQNLKYESATLAQRYEEQCGLAACLLWDLNDIKKWNTKFINTQNAFVSCRRIAQSRIQEETIYAKALILQESNQLLHDALHAYVYTYFWENKLMNLQSTILSLTDLFATIAKHMPEGTPECS